MENLKTKRRGTARRVSRATPVAVLAAGLAAVLAIILAGCGGTHASGAEQVSGEPVEPLLHQGALRSVPAASPLRKALAVAAVSAQSVQRPMRACHRSPPE